jgi:tetratricopeptide (TPR) repeat protein
MSGADRGQRRQWAKAGRDATIVGGDSFVVNILDPERFEPLIPGLLPRDVPGFTGRKYEMKLLADLAAGGPVSVTAIDGIAGVGKTALAVHAAHQLLPQFPDGQLYADLRGFTSGHQPAKPSEVLETFLRALGMPARDIPSSVEAQSSMLRSLLAGKRTLMLLDNAESESQVSPLLPGTGESLVIVTSRSTLPGLETDNRISLGVLDATDSIELLSKVIGHDRVATEPLAIEQVRESCGDLPLALRIAGHILTSHRTWPVAKLAQLLTNERDRLDRLTVGDIGVRAAFEISYKYLRGKEAKVFRLLGLYPSPNFDEAGIANLVAFDSKVVDQALEGLVEACLIAEIGPGHFIMHDLLRLFAYEVCQKTEKQEVRDAAQRRLVKHFIMIAQMVKVGISSTLPKIQAHFEGSVTYDITSTSETLELFESNRVGMLGALRIAEDKGWHDEAWQLFEPMSDVLLRTWRLDDLVDAGLATVSVARRAGDSTTEKLGLGVLGTAYSELGRHEDAIECFEEALAELRRSGDRKGEARTLTNFGNSLSRMECWEDATRYYGDALTIMVEIGDQHGRAQTLSNLASAYANLQDNDKAIKACEEALAVFGKIGDPYGRAASLLNLGAAYVNLERFEQSAALYEDAALAFKECGDQYHEAGALFNLGVTYRRLGRINHALDRFHAARDLYRGCGDSVSEMEVLSIIASLCYVSRQRDKAAYHFTEAAEVARDLGLDDESLHLETMAACANAPWYRLRRYRRFF